jgi:hypothetical protein
MPVTKRRIPRVAAALVLGGCSDAASNVDDLEREALSTTAMDFCVASETCDAYAFADRYVDQADCIDTFYSGAIDEVEDQTAGYGEACGDAGIAYFECLAATLGADCYAYVDDVCAAELEAIADNCGGV